MKYCKRNLSTWTENHTFSWLQIKS